MTALRRYRDEVGAKPSATLRGHLAAEGYDACAAHMARLARFEWVDGADADGDVVATVPIPGGGVQVLPSDAFDAGEARQRVEKKRAAWAQEDAYLFPGAIQYWGPSSVADITTETLKLESN